MRRPVILPAFPVQAVQERHERIDFALTEAERMNEPVEIRVRMRAAVKTVPFVGV